MRTIVNTKRPAGFTLIELSMVVLIIGLLLAFVLAAAAQGLEAARVRATQALITKLSVGLEERLEAILSISAEPNGAHRFLASTPITNPPFTTAQANALPWGLPSEQRAQVIARLDQIRREFPDVFFIDPAAISGGTPGLYPVRFGGLPYPNPADSSAGFLNYVLPIGHMLSPDYAPNSKDANGNPIRLGPGAQPPTASNTPDNGAGINGASYSAAASLYKLIGYTPKGYDGKDNDVPGAPGFGFVDDYLEGISDPNESSGSNTEARDKVDKFLTNHRHKTARAEMLYALLVEGLGPFGSVFASEEFRDTEVRDTDNDGVPEFVDGWGEPLQFYRWPLAHESALQKGAALYNGFGEPRQQMPLDQNNQLTAIAWWTTNDINNPGQPSAKNLIVQNLLIPLADPNWVSGTQNPGNMWDRSGATGRRAYMVKFLIVSGGPDREVGIPRMGDIQVRGQNVTAFQLAQAVTGQVTYNNGAFTFAAGESWAMPLPWGTDATLAQALMPSWAPNPYEPYLDTDYTVDDISNQDIQSRAGGFQ